MPLNNPLISSMLHNKLFYIITIVNELPLKIKSWLNNITVNYSG